MNSKGAGEIIMFFPFVFIMLVIGTGIVLGVNSFYSKGYDIRADEASLLLEQVKTCFSDNDFFDPNFDVSVCGWKKEILEGNYLIYINDNDKEFIIGVRDFTNQCFLNVKNNKEYPVCVNSTFVKDGKSFEILVGTNQNSRSILV